jgi:YVTN family beta-propeller protein
MTMSSPKVFFISPDEATLYVAAGRANKVMVLETNPLKLKTVIPVGKRVWGLALSRNGRRLYTTNGGDNTVSVIDTATNAVIDTLKVGEAPWGA